MDNLYTALSLCLIAKKRFVISTNNDKHVSQLFNSLVLQQSCKFNQTEICEIDLVEYLADGKLEDLVLASTNCSHNKYSFKSVIIWKNLQRLNHGQQKQLLKLINEIDQYETNISKLVDVPVKVGDHTIYKPELFVIVPIINHRHNASKVYQYLKEKFWFSVNYRFSTTQNSINEASVIEFPDHYEEHVRYLRTFLSKIYVSPDINRYIYSLIVHARNHRLCSLAPKQTRLSTRSIDDIQLLSSALVILKNYNTDKLYVTPDYVKIAMRKVGYWLVDWEQSIYAVDNPKEDIEYRKRLEISMLTGDWYGSEWHYVKNYLEKYRSKKDESKPTGYSNDIIEDAIRSVTPPL